MKNYDEVGKILTKLEQKEVFGGNTLAECVAYCSDGSSVSCAGDVCNANQTPDGLGYCYGMDYFGNILNFDECPS